MADITEQQAKYGDSDNTLLLKIAKATQTVSSAEAGDATAANQASQIAAEEASAASLAIIDDWDESDRAKVNPIAGQAGVQGASGAVTALTQRVVLATDVALPAGTNAIGGVKDNGPHWTTVLGVSGVAFTSADATTAAAVTSAPTAGQKLVITDIVASSDTALFLLFHEESTAGNLYFKVFLPANGTVQITPRSKVKLHTADKKLMVDASAAGNIAVTVTYFSEA